MLFDDNTVVLPLFGTARPRLRPGAVGEPLVELLERRHVLESRLAAVEAALKARGSGGCPAEGADDGDAALEAEEARGLHREGAVLQARA